MGFWQIFVLLCAEESLYVGSHDNEDVEYEHEVVF